MSIARVTDSVISVLRRELPPLIQPNRIALCPPSDRGEALLGVYLTDIGMDKRFRLDERVVLDENTLQPPPLCVELTYMITSYAGQPDDHKLLERVLQIWLDNSELKPLSRLQPDTVPNAKITLMELDADAKSKIWQFPGVPYYISLFYRVGPAVIESTKRIPARRVQKIELDIRRKEGS